LVARADDYATPGPLPSLMLVEQPLARGPIHVGEPVQDAPAERDVAALDGSERRLVDVHEVAEIAQPPAAREAAQAQQRGGVVAWGRSADGSDDRGRRGCWLGEACYVCGPILRYGVAPKPRARVAWGCSARSAAPLFR